MCGIIGYIGENACASTLVEGLHRLEYRGYDSAGVATVEKAQEVSRLQVCKAEGKVVAVEQALLGCRLQGTVGIGHTRWATHGTPTAINAHPHCSADNTVAVVHNGIIENFESLRKWLQAEGYLFASDTDTEVLPHLIERELALHYKKTTRLLPLEEAVSSALQYVEGAYAIAVISARHPDTLVGACNSSPLIIGIGEGEMYLASDEIALSGKVGAVMQVHNKEIVVLQRNGQYSFYGVPKEDIVLRLETPTAVYQQATKGGYAHYMYKEILEQPQAMRNVLAGRLREKGGVVFGGFTSSIETSLRKARRILLAGCGTSLFSAMTAKQHIESLAGVLCEVEQAAELYYRDPMLTFRDVFVGISQSGETADTLKSLELAKERHALCLAITNRVGSTLSRGVRAGIYLHAGPEVAVASTKAFTAQAVALLLLSIRLAELRNRDVPPQLRMQLLQLPSLLTATLAQEHVVKEWAAKYVAAPRVIVIGRGSGVALALEAALKLRECAYMDAHGLSAAELKHGTLALVEKGIPVFSVQPSGVLRSKMASNIKEIEARGGEVILLEPPAGLCDELVPIVLAPLMQLFAYHVGVLRGIDVDKPRNLAKAVSVE